jgi:N-methylhydantoinase B
MPGFFALHTLEDVVKRALSEGMPDRVNADDYGRCTPAHIKFLADGKWRIVADTEGGGWGATSVNDGEHGMLFGEVRVIPIEILEMRYPVRLRQYTLRQDSGGAGRFRGGLGVIKDYECLSDGKINAGFDRQVCPPQGIFGGGEAQSNRIIIKKREGDNVLMHSKITDYRLRKGDVVSLQTAGGGGYGKPEERDLERVERDLREGLISADAAVNLYGVVLTEVDGVPTIDRAATEARRGMPVTV